MRASRDQECVQKSALGACILESEELESKFQLNHVCCMILINKKEVSSNFLKLRQHYQMQTVSEDCISHFRIPTSNQQELNINFGSKDHLDIYI